MNTESDSERPRSRFRPSCLPCQRLKKKCDRRRPQCSLCIRHCRVCAYAHSSSSPVGYAAPNDGAQLNSVQDPKKPFPAVFFLDSVLFRRSVSELSDQAFTVEPLLLSFVGNVSADKEFLSSYLTFIHPWIPFLSKKHFMERIISPLGPAKPENTLLLAAVKLLANAPSEEDVRSDVYYAIKAATTRAESTGVLNFRIFQVTILLAIYELGHAIYPAAYFTIGNSVRYGNALGINDTVEKERPAEETQSPIEAEERRRSWWAAILLERFMSLGSAERGFLSRDPGRNSVLPIDDHLWERGEMAENHMHLLSSPPTETMGRYCLTAQAAILLGRVFRNMHDDLENEEFREHEARLLESTLVALTNVSLQEGQFRGIGVCSPTTICFSARLLLHDTERHPWGRYGKNTQRRMVPDVELEIAAYMLRLARSLGATGRCGAEEMSPFCLEPMYRSGIIYARRYSETGDKDDLDAFEAIKVGLQAAGSRWKAGVAYVGLLAARELTGVL